MTTPAEQKKNAIKFDPTINLGHVITILLGLIAVFGAWSTLDKRVLVLEENKYLQKQIDLAQDSRSSEAAQQIKEVLVRLDRQVERLADKIDSVSASGKEKH